MKKILFLFVAVIVTTSFLSCEDKDDGGVVNPSTLQIYGQNYVLSSGVIWKGSKFITTSTEEYIFNDTYEDEEGNTVTDEVVGFKASDGSMETGNFMISLYEDGMFYSPEIAATRGKGALLSLHLSSPDIEKLTPGKYLFSKIKEPNTFAGYSSSYYDMETGTDKPATLASGEINISMEASIYRINFNCKTSFGGEVKGEYVGPLMDVNVERDAIIYSENIELSGLQKTVVSNTYFFETAEGEVESLDYYDKGLFSTKFGTASTADAGNNEYQDIAVFCDEDNNSLFFESPIKIRVRFEHSDDYTFPCHTTYKLAPSSFTDNDFDTLTEFDFEITDEEERVEISVDNFHPCYVFFIAGNGTKGVMKVKSIKPSREAKIDIMPGLWWVIYNNSPTISVDIKCTASLSNPAIR